MSLFSAIEHLAHEYQAARTRYLTEREIGSLPFEIQKDIGWPPVTEGTRGRNFDNRASGK